MEPKDLVVILKDLKPGTEYIDQYGIGLKCVDHIEKTKSGIVYVHNTDGTTWSAGGLSTVRIYPSSARLYAQPDEEPEDLLAYLRSEFFGYDDIRLAFVDDVTHAFVRGEGHIHIVTYERGCIGHETVSDGAFDLLTQILKEG